MQAQLVLVNAHDGGVTGAGGFLAILAAALADEQLIARAQHRGARRGAAQVRAERAVENCRAVRAEDEPEDVATAQLRDEELVSPEGGEVRTADRRRSDGGTKTGAPWAFDMRDMEPWNWSARLVTSMSPFGPNTIPSGLSNDGSSMVVSSVAPEDCPGTS